MNNHSARIAELSPAKRALLEARLDAGRERVTPIAVIGMSCRFPGAPNAEAFWKLLQDGIDAISEVPKERWDADAFYDPDPAKPGKMNTRWGGFLDRVDCFDPHFFGISPREAARMDPQQRLMLQVVWEALEDAGQVAERLGGSATGVFIGIATNDYAAMQLGDTNGIDGHSGTGSAMSIAANRISYFFDFRGPSMAIDTACSSSLVAVHLACQSLWRGESKLALAGGVNLILTPGIAINFSKAGAMAPDGRCKAFDARANGYVRGEGAGVVVLKRLSAALADGDPIHAVIRGSAVNQDGRTNGLMAPNRYSQEAVLREAYGSAGIPPGEVQFVESHGTGTLLGDPIEAAALGAVLAVGRPPEQRCVLGSVKTNIGHLEAAAGIAGLIKVVLSLKHRQVPRNLHFVHPNPHIPFDTLPLRVAREMEPWISREGPRLAGVNSFGFGGTNAHVVLEEAPEVTAATYANDSESVDRHQVLPLSARSPEALRDLARGYRDFLADSRISFADLCYTAGARRSHHDHRLALAACSKEEARDSLEAFLAGETRPNMSAGASLSGRLRKLAFVFSGQGSQWEGMGRQLLKRQPVFRESIERCDATLRKIAGWSLVEALRGETSLTEIDVIQPTLFAVQVALCHLWRSWGIEADAVVGHSMGEIAAAHVAGALSLPDALRIVWWRSRLMKRTSGSGATAVVELPPDKAALALNGYEGRLSVAACNSPVSTAISGEPAALGEWIAALEARGVFCRAVKVDVAAHSPQMEPLRAELLDGLSGIVSSRPAISFYSTVQSGKVQDFNAEYWWRNLRGTVHFAAAVDRLLDSGHDLFLEISPHPILLTSLVDSMRIGGRKGTAHWSLRRDADEEGTLLASLAALYSTGWPVDWNKQYAARRRVVPLPLYPWQQERCWFTPVSSAHPAVEGIPGIPFLGARLRVAGSPEEDRWETWMSPEAIPSFVLDHRIQGVVVLPGAGYVEMALAAARQITGAGFLVLSDVTFHKAMFLAAGVNRCVQTVLSTTPAGERTFSVYSRSGAGSEAETWTLHAEGKICPGAGDGSPAQHHESVEEIRRRLGEEEMDGAEFYANTRAFGNDYGPCHQGIDRLWRGEREVLAEIRAPGAIETDLASYQLHPALLDAVWQALGASISLLDQESSDGPTVPVHIDRIEVKGRPGPRCWSHATLDTDANAGEHVGNVHLLDETGQCLVATYGLRLRALDAGAERASGFDIDGWLYEMQWRPRPRSASAGRAPGRWIILADSGGVARELARLLDARGDTAILVRPGADLEQVLRQVAGESSVVCHRVLHLWALDQLPECERVAGTLEQAQAGCAGALCLIQALAKASLGSVALWLVTRGAQPVDKTARFAVTQSPLWGLGRVIAQEHPALWGGLIDLDPESTEEQSAAALLLDLDDAEKEDQIGYRGGKRFVARLERKERSIVPRELTWRPDAAYLITGGLGDLGLEAARWMVKRGARNLILLSRTALPPRDSAGIRIRAIREIEEMGANVTVAAVDVADEGQLSLFLERYRQDGFAPIRGVIHAAGVVQMKPLAELEPAELLAVLRPKVAGAWLLHRLLADADLDFFVLFSSFASILSSPQLGAYAAANAFLDGLAHRRKAEGRPAIAINWAAWSRVGMAARYLQGGRALSRGVQGFSPEQGLAVLERLLTQDSAQVGVMRVDWPVWARLYPVFTASPLISDLIRAEAHPAGRNGKRQADPIRETLIAAEPRSRERILEAWLHKEAARVLGLAVARLDPHRSLTALGFDSLMAVELRNRVETGLEVTLPLVEILQGPSVAALAGTLLEHVTASALLTRDPERANEAPVDGDWETIRL